ncbi:branched-chain amino acid ABC transporter permease [Pseudacidovorax intermedius]|uniref:branched-chain amino acid ABC transporter permease n=1 Tax=Pseudacidovorax intermedius TaxID=433924 RepID=UPI0026EDCC40|nr:branched-chain amino acid ABC transporter permease [Pseudacidovorax intermedius]
MKQKFVFPAVLGLLALVLASGNAYLINLFVIAAMTTLPAIGLSLLMGYTGQISLGHAAFVGLGAYASALLCKSLGLNPWLAMALATALSAGAAWCIGWLVFRLRGHHLAMATLAFGIIIHVAMVEWRSFTGGQDGLADVPSLQLLSFDLRSDAAMLCIAWAACLLAVLLAGNLVRSPFGFAMRTVAENEAVAGSIGIASASLKRKVMAVGGAYAGFGGALYAHWLGYISPGPFDVGYSVRLLLIVALGGFSGLWSVVFGVFFVVITSEALKPLGRFDVVIYGVLLVFVMVRCPQGLLAGIHQLFDKLAAGARRRAGSDA